MIKEFIMRKISLILALFLIVSTSILLMGCKVTHEAVKSSEVDSSRDVKTEIQYVTRIDSVFQDRVHEVYINGDTVIIHDSIVCYRYVVKSDTITHLDTIIRFVEKNNDVVKVVKKKQLIWWPFVMLGVVALILVSVWYRKLR